MSAFNRRFSGGGVWFIQDKFAFTGNLVIKTGHTAGSYGKCRLQTEYKRTSYKMQTVYKMRSRYKMQTADGVQNSDFRYKMQADKKNCFFSLRNIVTFDYVSYLLSRSNLAVPSPMCRT